MKKKILYIALSIALAAALVGGGTMAYFSFKVEAENEFYAGYVTIEAGNAVYYSDEKDYTNVNPGDAFKKCIKITNIGSKAIELRLVDFEFTLDIDWDYIRDNFEELCFSEVMDGDHPRWPNWQALQAEVDAALDAPWNEYRVTHPGYAYGDPAPNNPFDENGRLINPIMAAPTPISDWIMKYVEGETVFYYNGGPLTPGDYTDFCVVLRFDGPWMGNLWQNADFIMSGTFQAVQASNDAPQEVWGESTWDNYQDVSNLDTSREQLAATFGDIYADYFYDNGEFIYAYLCEMNGNDNGNGEFVGTGSAWGEGTPYGPGEPGFQIAMYFDYVKGSVLTVELELQEGATRLAVGDIWVDGNGTLYVRVSTEDYYFENDPNKPMAMTEAQLYASTKIPEESAPGQFPYEHKPAQPFTEYTFEVTHIHNNPNAEGDPDIAISDLEDGSKIYLALHAVTGYVAQ